MKKVWEFLNGKKTVIAALAGVALSWTMAKGYLSAQDAEYMAMILSMLTGVAVGHKAYKAVKE